MRVVEKLLGRKAFVPEPPFWSLDSTPLWVGVAGEKERIENDFTGYVYGAYKANGVIFACMMTRQLLLSEARFQWRKFLNGKAGDLFGTGDLSLLEHPWPNGTTGELIAMLDQDATLAGNSYWTLADDDGNLGKRAKGPSVHFARMRPDKVYILIGSQNDDPEALDRRIVAFVYDSKGLSDASVDSDEVSVLMPDEVCHYSPIPDPIANYRGMSWLTPIVREIESDSAATKHKLAFFENGAQPGVVARAPKETSPERFKQFVEMFKQEKVGPENAYKTLFLGGGFDVDIMGRDFQQLEFRATQGAGETRIAAAARIPPAIIGLSEGLSGSSLNAGNFNAARRLCADGFLRPAWRGIAASLEQIIKPPQSNVRLWYDDRDIPFLREDEKDVAAIQQIEAQIIRTLLDGGCTMDSIVKALLNNDWALLEHSGLFSVQLQPPGSVARVAAGEEIQEENRTNGEAVTVNGNGAA